VLQVLQMIPEESHVGLITFGMHVHVHELGFSECSKCFVFRGTKEYTSAQVHRALLEQQLAAATEAAAGWVAVAAADVKDGQQQWTVQKSNSADCCRPAKNVQAAVQPLRSTYSRVAADSSSAAAKEAAHMQACCCCGCCCSNSSQLCAAQVVGQLGLQSRQYSYQSAAAVIFLHRSDALICAIAVAESQVLYQVGLRPKPGRWSDGACICFSAAAAAAAAATAGLLELTFCATSLLQVVDQQGLRSSQHCPRSVAAATFTHQSDAVICAYANAELQVVDQLGLRPKLRRWSDGACICYSAAAAAAAAAAGLLTHQGGHFVPLLQVVDQLGLRPTAPRPGAPVQQGVAGRQFILPLADVTCETAINNVLGDLQRDAYPVMSDQRPARCTGTAMQVGRVCLYEGVHMV
jgi:hypothetical protein